MSKQAIGFGGSCHWCTEAIFQSLIGVEKVEQGWIASKAPNDSYSEAVSLTFNPKVIPLETLIEIHLLTHSCTSAHAMRKKYRSAVYITSRSQGKLTKATIEKLQAGFEKQIITKTLPLKAFKLNEENYLNYYQNNPEKPFCQTHIVPKLSILITKYSRLVKKQ